MKILNSNNNIYSCNLKCMLLFVAFAFLTNNAKAETGEFKVDCGSDTIYCLDKDQHIDFHIGSNVKIENGIPPFKYSWTCDKYLYIHWYNYASDFLNDTTIVNPIIQIYSRKKGVFYLQVTDSVGNIAQDSLTVYCSVFAYGLGGYSFTIKDNESINFGDAMIGGGIKPLQYYWTPTYKVRDTASSYTNFAPDTTITYYQYAIDSVGCKSYKVPVLTVIVEPVSIKSVNQEIPQIKLIGSTLFFDNFQKDWYELHLYSAEGKLVYTSVSQYSQIELPGFLKKNQIYLGKVNCDGKSLSFKIKY